MSKGKFRSRILESTVKTLYLDEETADVHFIFKSNGHSERVPAHKTLLIAVSKVFRAMFNGQWKEKDEVPIPDVLADDFKAFLQYFYFSEVELSMENVEGVMSLCHQYDIEVGFNDCATLLELNLSLDNVCSTYRLAIFYDNEELKTECEIFISLNTEDVLKSSGFLDCDRETLSHILRLDSMSCSESCVFNACMEFVKAASNQDEMSKELVENHLGNVFYDIRFGSMTLEEFNAIHTTHGFLFSTHEQNGIKEMIKSKEKQWKLFNGSDRVNPWKKASEVGCYRNSKIDKDHVEIVRFSTNKTLLLKSIVCSNAYYRDDDSDSYVHLDDYYDIVTSTLTVKEINPHNAEKSKPRVVHVNRSIEHPNRDDNENNEDQRVIRFPKPLIIKRGFKYELCLEPDGELRANKCTSMAFKVKMKSGPVLTFDKGTILDGEDGKLISELRFGTV